jgi:hypothetical protein
LDDAASTIKEGLVQEAASGVQVGVVLAQGVIGGRLKHTQITESVIWMIEDVVRISAQL